MHSCHTRGREEPTFEASYATPLNRFCVTGLGGCPNGEAWEWHIVEGLAAHGADARTPYTHSPIPPAFHKQVREPNPPYGPSSVAVIRERAAVGHRYMLHYILPTVFLSSRLVTPSSQLRAWVICCVSRPPRLARHMRNRWCDGRACR